MYYCPKCQPKHPGGFGYSLAYCSEHRLPAPRFATSRGAAEELGLDASHIRRLCITGMIEGAEKWGRDWRIPIPVIRLDN